MNEIIEKDLITALGLEDAPREKQLEIIEKTGAVLFGAIMQEAITRIPEQELDSLDELMSDPTNTDKVYLFLRDKIDNFDQMVEKVVADFKSETLQILDSLK